MNNKLFFLIVLASVFLTACDGGKAHSSAIGNASMNVQGENLEGIQDAVLYEDCGVKVSVMAVESSADAKTSYVLRMDNQNDEEFKLSLTDWIINDTFRIGTEEYLYAEPHCIECNEMTQLSELIYYEDIQAITSIQCHLEIRNEAYEIVAETDIAHELSQPLVSGEVYDVIKGAKAGEQVLVDDENVQVILKGWGKNPSSNYVQGIVYFENKGENQIPVMIDGISINGIFLDIFDHVNFLKKGDSCYSSFDLLESEIEDEGIESITDVQLLVMTDESQNTGNASYGGGEWYPVKLDEKGEMEAVFETGEPMEILEDVEISYVGYEFTEWSNGGGNYRWKLAVINNSDENIKIAVTDCFIDGISEEEWNVSEKDRSFFLSDTDVGAHSNRYIYANISCYDEVEVISDIKFKFQIRSMAGGGVICSGKEQFTLKPE